MASSEAEFDLSVTSGEGPSGASIRIAAQGELDSAASARLLEAFRQAMATGREDEPGTPDGPPPAVVLDLGQVTFIDSSGMRTVITIERESKRGRVALSLTPPPDDLTRLLRIAGVAEHLGLAAPSQANLSEVDFLERVELELPVTDASPRRARAAVREALSGGVDEELLPTIVLMTSEVVTNAVIHPGPGDPPLIGLRVVVLPRAVRVEVDDPGEGFDPAGQILPEGSVPDPGAGGRGLFVVDRFATRWGSRRVDTDRGRRFAVWFEVQTG